MSVRVSRPNHPNGSRQDARSPKKRFLNHKRAWTYFSQQASYYRRTALWWVISAKRPETQLRRLATLIADSDASRRLPMLSPKTKRGT